MPHPQYGTLDGKGLNFYEVLGVDPLTATDRDIQKMYRKTALIFHPDRNKDPRAVDMFEMVQKAFEVLSEEETKAKYDKILEGKLAAERRDMERTRDQRDKRAALERREQAAKEEREAGRKAAATSFTAMQSAQKDELSAILATRKRKRAETAAELEAELQKEAASRPAPAAPFVNIVDEAFTFFDATRPAPLAPEADVAAALDALEALM
eukprot:TRINITY_DN21300_c0_g1_i1.p1 TRINITY_DN21300_c0_g1~~TRINITY_DN21300_c0_g1_i1.p1  ORF type:complete len:210 (+),score=87.59 TRINITY_DN21300_c0_g1_i1:64-693(+)